MQTPPSAGGPRQALSSDTAHLCRTVPGVCGALSVSWAHHLAGQPVRGAGPGSYQASGGRRVTPGNIVMEARGPEGRLRSRGPRLPALSQCSPAVRGLYSHGGSLAACGPCPLRTERHVLGRPRGSEGQDFAPFRLSDAPPCGVGLPVTGGHSPWRLCRCGRARRGSARTRVAPSLV